MTLDEAIEQLGALVAKNGGEGDEALDVVKDALAHQQREINLLVTGEDR